MRVIDTNRPLDIPTRSAVQLELQAVIAALMRNPGVPNPLEWSELRGLLPAQLNGVSDGALHQALLDEGFHVGD